MKRLILTFTLIFCAVAFADSTFDIYGVWHPVESTTLSAGQRTSSGPVAVYRREKHLNFLVYGSFTDSMRPTLQVYGMMTMNIADTTKAVLIGSKTEYTDATTMAFADSLDDNQLFPFLFVKLTNDHPDSNGTFDVYCHIRPEQQTIIRR